VDGVMISCLQVPGLTVADFLHPAASSFGVLTGDAAGPRKKAMPSPGRGPGYSTRRDTTVSAHGHAAGQKKPRNACMSSAQPACTLWEPSFLNTVTLRMP